LRIEGTSTNCIDPRAFTARRNDLDSSSIPTVDNSKVLRCWFVCIFLTHKVECAWINSDTSLGDCLNDFHLFSDSVIICVGKTKIYVSRILTSGQALTIDADVDW